MRISDWSSDVCSSDLALTMERGGTGGLISLSSIEDIVLQLLLPFIVGHLARPWIGGFVSRHRAMLGRVDRGSILLVVYAAFSAAVVEGLWQDRKSTRLNSSH